MTVIGSAIGVALIRRSLQFARMIIRGRITNIVVTLVGVLTASFGAFAGYATSATGKYDDLLRIWAIATALSLVVLAWQVSRVRGWPRNITIGLMMFIAGTSIEPFRRIVLLGWS